MERGRRGGVGDDGDRSDSGSGSERRNGGGERSGRNVGGRRNGDSVGKRSGSWSIGERRSDLRLAERRHVGVGSEKRSRGQDLRRVGGGKMLRRGEERIGMQQRVKRRWKNVEGESDTEQYDPLDSDIESPSPDESSRVAFQPKKRIRNVRFTQQENDILVDKVLKVYDKLFGKISGKTSTTEKNKMWVKICDSVNSMGVYHRTTENCKKRFADCKRKLKEKLDKQRNNSGVTDGEPAQPIKLSAMEQRLQVVIVPKVIHGIPGVIYNEAADLEEEAGPSWRDETPMRSSGPVVPICIKELSAEEDLEGGHYRSPQADANSEDMFTMRLENITAMQEMQTPQSSPSHGSPLQEEEEQLDGPGDNQANQFYEAQESFQTRIIHCMSSMHWDIRSLGRKFDEHAKVQREQLVVHQQTNAILSQMVGCMQQRTQQNTSSFTELCNVLRQATEVTWPQSAGAHSSIETRSNAQNPMPQTLHHHGRGASGGRPQSEPQLPPPSAKHGKH
ncbi:hypothetical protein FKM82_005236 [Ascaphus truei]|uniref:uncharacterized protein LOC142465079 n=1 Tax=Ascaphus truei TaxID=8439 RepID=UPI003F5A270A